MTLTSANFNGVSLIGPGQMLSALSPFGGGSMIIRSTPPSIAINGTFNLNGILTITGSILGLTLQSAPISGDTALTPSESGTWFSIDPAAGPYTIILPTPSNGLNFKFFLSAAGAGGEDVVVSHASLTGDIIDITAGFSVTPATGPLTFVGGTATAGDNIEVYAIGSIWFYKAVSGAVGGITS